MLGEGTTDPRGFLMVFVQVSQGIHAWPPCVQYTSQRADHIRKPDYRNTLFLTKLHVQI